MKSHISHIIVIVVIVSFSLIITTIVSAKTFDEFSSVKSSENIVLAGQPGITVVGEVRTVDEIANPRLWGKGRPNTKRYGTAGVESGLCIAGSIDYGLSFNVVDWGSAADACPAGTWVCSIDDLKSGGMPYSACNTARPDTIVDEMTCDGTGLNAVGSSHRGWLADTHATETYTGYTYSEALDISNVFSSLSCESRPVWCCSEATL